MVSALVSRLSGLGLSASRALALIGDTFQPRIGIWKCWFLRRGENQSIQRKTSQTREENQQQTQPAHDVGSRNLTRDILVEGEHSHHCAIPAHQNTLTVPLSTQRYKRVLANLMVVTQQWTSIPCREK